MASPLCDELFYKGECRAAEFTEARPPARCFQPSLCVSAGSPLQAQLTPAQPANAQLRMRLE